MAPQRDRTYEPIAIIGSGCRFPGDSCTPSKLWDLLSNPRNVASEIPSSRFNPHGHYHPDGKHHGTSNVRESYLLSEDIRLFDAQFFGIKAVEANSIDPQQRLLLETVYEGVESAGLKIEKLKGSNTAVYVGVMCGEYTDMMTRDPDAFPMYFATGTARSIVSNRVSYFFDWRGPSMTIDTACSSSLIALHQAVQVLRSGESQIAIAAGSNLIIGPESYIAESKLQMLSPTGRSRMWDADADGYARGDGVAAVVLKTLSRALADGDHIECIVRETGTNHDGRTKGITMPSPTAQMALIHETYAKAGLDLAKKEDRPQYFEAHGTGTPTGDPIEAEAISTAFFGPGAKYRTTSKKNGGDILYVGSIKSVVGHTEGTAGLAAVLKVSLALQHREIPPNMLLNKLNPKIEPFYQNLEIPTTMIPWPKSRGPRRVSVNSFGFGGSNAHAILESWEPSGGDAANRTRKELALTPFIFSAGSERSLSAMLSSYADYLEANPTTNLRDLAWTLASRRSTLQVRAVIAGATLGSLQTKLDTAIADISSVAKRIANIPPKARYLGVFTGQGAQWTGMGRGLILASDAAASVVRQLEQSLAELPASDRPDWSLMSELLTDAKTTRLSRLNLNQAVLSQPLCTAVQIILIDHLRAAGIQFDAVVGHSSGEIAAAYAAGYLTARDAIRIAYYRGLHAKLACGPDGKKGAMMAVGTSMDDANELCQLEAFENRICVAASNSSASVTLSGDADAIQEAKVVFDEEKKFSRLLKVDTAYHSHHMLRCSDAYMRSLQACNIQIQKPNSACVWISSVYGEAVPDIRDDLTCQYWNNNMVRPVLFSQAIECAIGEKGPFDAAVEVGPHPALKGPATQTIQEVSGENIHYTGVLSRDKEDVEAFAEGLGYIWTHLGEAAVDFNGYDKFASDGPQPKLVKNLPAYPWDHDRQYWSESRLSKAYRIRDGPFHELLGFRCADGTEREIRWRNLLRPKEVPWLYGHQIQGQMVFPGAGYISTAVEAVKAIIGKEQARIVEVHDLHIGQAAIFDNEDSSVETLFVLSEIDHAIGEHLSAHFSFYSSDSAESTSMTLNARGRIRVTFGSSVETALPSRGPEGFNMIDVNADRFYETLAELGFNYSGEFKNLSKLRRKLGMATGTIINPASSDPERALLVHPAMLDGAIQSIILAYCWPGDGRLRSIHVPVRIRRVAINIGLCHHDGNQTYFPFDSSLDSNTTSEIDGDVDIFTPDGRHCMIQVEGMHAVPFSGSTAADDFHLFSDLVWNVANPDANSAAFDEKATSNEYELAYLMERVAYFYTRALHKAIGPQQRQTWEWHHEHLFRWGTEMIQRVKNGVDENIKKEWDNDSHEDILAQIARYPESIDLKVMHAIGENMPAVVRGETTILEHLMKDNLLNDYYVNALGFHRYTNYLARMVGQIVHRYPRMNILEVGAGTGGATKSIFKEIGSSFMSYTFTDISSGFFEKAQEVFNDFSSQMVFKALNAEQDIENQGFVEHSYDLIIASLVIHATKNLERTLSNVRRLLKPGGYLVLLEITNNDLMRLGFIFGCLPGWWLGVDDNRTMSPCIPTQQWDTVLRKAGFAGVETTTPDSDVLPYPLSVICAQAIDERIEFLREPLLAIPEQIIREQLTVIGGNTPRTAPLAKSICALLPQRTITSWLSLEEFGIEGLKVAPTGTVLSLVDLDDPIFKSMTAAKLKGLKALFEQFRNILWVTSGARSDDPYSNMIIGFGRCVLLEMPHIRLQFLDLDKSSALNPRIVADTLIRFETVHFWEEDGHLGELLWSVEPEIAIQQHQQLIPRLKLNKTRNSRYNSSRRLITKKLDPRTKAVKITHSGATYELQEDVSSRMPKTGRQFIQVLYSVLQPLKVAPATYVYLVLGRSNDGRQVLSFSRVQSSIVEVSDKWIIPCPQDIEQGVHFMPMVAIQLIVLAMLKDLAAGDTLVVLEPPRNLANALSRRALEYGINAVYLTTNSDVIQDPSWVRLHPNFPKRAIKAAIPSNATYFEDMSGNEILAAQVTECLPPLCKIGRSLASVNEQCQAGSDDKLDPILALLKTVWFRSQIESLAAEMDTIPTIPLDTIPHGLPLNQQSLFSIVDWNIEPSIDVKLQPVDARPLFSPEKTYWLVGLTGGLGQSLCQWMIEHGASHIVITSRHPNVDSRWKESMERLGAVVQIIANDVTDRVALKMLYDDICATLPPLGGIAQGAMVLSDAMFLETDIDKLSKVLKPKVDGSLYFNELLGDKALDFFVFFSSVAAVTGNAGQSIYGAANMFMAGLAAQRRKRGLAASVINIGAIIGNGYVTREVSQAQQNALRSYGNTWMSEQDFHQIFAEGVLASDPSSSEAADIVTGLRLVNAEEDDKPIWLFNPKFQNFVLQGEGAESKSNVSKAGVPVKVRLLEAITNEEVYEILKESFIIKLRAMLQLTDDEEKLNAVIGMGADELGIDSLVAVEIRSWFIKELTVDLSVLKILGGASIGDLLLTAQEKLPANLIPNIGADRATVPKRTETNPPSKKAEAKLVPKTSSKKVEPSTKTEPQASKSTSIPSVPSKFKSPSGNVKTVSAPVIQQPPADIGISSSKTDLDSTRIKEAKPLVSSFLPSIEVLSDNALRNSRIRTKQFTFSSRTSFILDSEDSILENRTPPSSASSVSSNEKFNKDVDIQSQLAKKSPMSFGQSRFWFLKHFLEDQTTFNITCSIRLHGNLRVDDFEQAIKTVAERHEALRTCLFVGEQERPMQGVLQTPTLHLERKSVADEAQIATELSLVKNHVFDIERGENMRILLLSLSPALHQIIIGYHHINMDGISLEVILAELQKAYNQQPFSHEALQYADFSARQRREYAEGKWSAELSFWKEEFPDFPPPMPLLSLSRKTSRVALTSYAFESTEFKVEKSLASKIQETCRRFKVTPFHFYLAAYKALILRFLDTDDICIGIADGNRNDSDTTDAVGFYLNLLPLRFKTQERQTFSDALKEAKNKAYGALANSRVPFDVLLAEVGVPRTAGHNPLFQVFINYRQGVKENRPFCDCVSDGLEFQSGKTAYDVNLDVIDYADGDATVMLMVQKGLYNQEDAEVLGKCYLNLLQAFSRNAAVRIDRPALFSIADVQEAVEIGRGPIRENQWPETMIHRIADMVKAHGNMIAVRDGVGNSLTYSELDQRANAVAASLSASNASSGSCIGVFQEPSADWIYSLIAIWKLGAIYVPLDPRSPTTRLTTIIRDCKAEILLVHSASAREVSALKFTGKVINVSSLDRKTHKMVPITVKSEMPAMIAYTSGSTGVPKGIILKHSGIINNTEWATQHFHFDKDTVLQQSSLSFDMSLSQICIALANGGNLFIVPQSARGDSLAIAKIIKSEGISFTQATPSEYISWLRHGDSKLLQSSKWRIACSGGEQVTDTLIQGFRTLHKPDLRLFTGYGPTEITFTSNSLELSYADNEAGPDADRVPAGFTWPNYSVYVVDDNLQAVPVGVPGEIVIGGAGVASGYHENVDLSRERFITDEYASSEFKSKEWVTIHRTGDRGRLRRDGALVIEGRIMGDTQIKLRGLRIELKDIESTIIEASNGTLLEAVVSLRNADSEESKYLIAHATFSPAHPIADRLGYLKRLLASLPLPQYMRPAVIILLDRMPMNSSSKLDRLAVSKLPLPEYENTDDGPTTLTAMETRLKETWEEVLPQDIAKNSAIDSSTDFFSVGGSSLLLVKLRTHIQRNFDIDLPLVKLFEASTLGSMASWLGRNGDDEIEEIQIPKANTIDWVYEIQLPAVSHLDLPLVSFGPKTGPKTVILTGATGFLGKVILQKLLDDDGIEKVHCIAVRHSPNRLAFFSSPKLVVHGGDLTLPRLGLSEAEANRIFRKADAIIHNGADVSFLKTYHSLKQPNVESTKELIRMSLPQRTPFHFISSASIAHLSDQDVFEEGSAANYLPPNDGSDGYTATKWVNERLLENISETFGVPVFIHRPSSVTGEDAPALDVMTLLMQYSRRMKAVPVSDSWRGYFDFISVELVARDVVSELFVETPRASKPTKYLHHSGELEIPVSGIKEFLEEESGVLFEALPLGEWAERASKLGLDGMVAAFLIMVEGNTEVMRFPRLRRKQQLIRDIDSSVEGSMMAVKMVSKDISSKSVIGGISAVKIYVLLLHLAVLYFYWRNMM